MSRHLEATVTVIVASTVAVLGIVDLASARTVSAATLAVLALLAFRMAAPPGSPVPAWPTPNGPTRGRSNLQEADDIRIVGVTLIRTVRNGFPDLERRLAAGATIRVAIIEPHGEPPDEAARRSGLTGGRHVFEHRLASTLDLLQDLHERFETLEIRLLPFVPAYGLLLVDSDSATGSVEVDVYSHRMSEPETRLRLGRRRDRTWFEYFRREFDHLWASGRPLARPAVAGRTAGAHTPGE